MGCLAANTMYSVHAAYSISHASMGCLAANTMYSVHAEHIVLAARHPIDT